MPKDVIVSRTFRYWLPQLKAAATFAQVQAVAYRFTAEELHVETAVLSKTAVADSPAPSVFVLHLAVGHTGYWLTLTRAVSFDDDEQALAETAVALLATAPFFRPKPDAAHAPSFETLYDIAETVRILGPLQPTLERVQQKILTAFSGSSGFIALHDSDSKHISFPCLVDHQQVVHQEPISSLHPESLASWVVANGLPYFSNDWPSDDKPAPGLVLGTEPASVMCVPMFYHDDVLGAISVQSDVGNAFQPADYETLQAIAAHVATAVHNARLYARAQELVAKGTRDYQVAIALRQAISAISSTLEQDAVLKHLILALDGILTFDTAHIFLWEHPSLKFSGFKLVASHDTAGRPLEHSPADLEGIWRDHPLLQEIYQEKETILLNNPEADARRRGYD